MFVRNEEEGKREEFFFEMIALNHVRQRTWYLRLASRLTESTSLVNRLNLKRGY